MKTRLAALASAALLGALAAASGCAENRASVQTQRICFPTKDCVFAATCDMQLIGTPALDLDVAPNSTLTLFLQVANNLPNNSNVSIGRVNTNDAHIDETYIEYEGSMGGTKAVGSNQLVPAAGTAVVAAEFNLTGAAAGEVLAHLRFRGYYDDGTRFETGDFPVTIIVCGGGTTAGACTMTPTSAGCDPTKLICPNAGQTPFACTTG